MELVFTVVAGVVGTLIGVMLYTRHRAKGKVVLGKQGGLQPNEAQAAIGSGWSSKPKAELTVLTQKDISEIPTTELAVEPSLPAQIELQPQVQTTPLGPPTPFGESLAGAVVSTALPPAVAPEAPAVSVTEESRLVEIHSEQQIMPLEPEAYFKETVEMGAPGADATAVAPEIPSTCEIQMLPRPRRVNPEKRGGRSRVEARKSEQEEARKGRARAPKPEVVCWKREREWVLGVEVPEEIRAVSVFQNGRLLTKDELETGCWQLAELCGEVIVSSRENEREIQSSIALNSENCLVFKLSGIHGDQGRRVTRPARGSYLVVAPGDWQRDEELAGPAPAKPEPVCLEAYRAHFFYLGNGQQCALRDGMGRLVVMDSGEPRFNFVGRELH
jgi:hypothetical protein